MNYLKQSTDAEVSIQLFNASDVPVNSQGVADVLVEIRKQNEGGFSQKPPIPLVLNTDWFIRSATTPGMYILKFLVADTNVLGLLRLRVTPVTPGTFKVYEESFTVVTSLPVFPVDPPTINSQTSTPPGMSPNPVAHNATLTINGTNLGGATSVTIDNQACTITANTATLIQCTVNPAILVGKGKTVAVTTPGGTVVGTVDVTFDPTDIPTNGYINIVGRVQDPSTGLWAEGAAVNGILLETPNIAFGVGWQAKPRKVSTDANGNFSLPMPREVMVRVSIPSTNFVRTFKTPSTTDHSASTINLYTEIPT